MARACTICTHKQQRQIDRDLVTATPLRRIAARYGVAESSLHRHRARHLAPEAAAAIARHQELSAEVLVSWLVGLHDRTVYALVKAERDGDHAAQRGFIREARENLELLARLGGFVDGPTIHVDARQQTAVLASLSEEDLRALAAHARAGLPSPARELEAGAETVEAEVVG